jgi:hypothetical protein
VNSAVENGVKPVMNAGVRFKLLDGSVVALKKDCSCADHDGPHWLYADALWKRRNAELGQLARDERAPADRRFFAMQGMAVEESARLNAKLVCMRRLHISEILYDKPESARS